MNALLFCSLLIAQPPQSPPATEPKPVAVNRVEEKELLEAHKKARPRLPMPPLGEGRGVNNGRFREFYLPDMQSGGAPNAGREPDPAMSLDNTFKVKLFWITSRANNCYYCLGHQEHKLAAAGVSDDGIAALDGDWSEFTPAERAAFAFTRKLTVEPNKVTTADVDELKKHYKQNQVLEILLTVAGYNATNRWTDGLNIPAEENASFFRKGDEKADFSKFNTPTSEKYAKAVSTVATLTAGATTKCQPSWPARPELESRADVEAALLAAAKRTAILPLAEGDGANWVKLLKVFPKTGQGRIDGVTTAAEKGDLPPRIKAEIAWACARTDRAWYALSVAKARLKAIGFSDDEMFAIDDPKSTLPDREKLAVAFAHKLAHAPATVTDADVEGLRKVFPDKQVAEIVHQVCTAAFFDRLTETAQLPTDK